MINRNEDEKMLIKAYTGNVWKQFKEYYNYVFCKFGTGEISIRNMEKFYLDDRMASTEEVQEEILKNKKMVMNKIRTYFLEMYRRLKVR